MSNSIDKSYFRHNGASIQQCRTPSTYHKPFRRSAMSNSINVSQAIPPFKNVELHRLFKLTRPVFSLEIAVELSDTAN